MISEPVITKFDNGREVSIKLEKYRTFRGQSAYKWEAESFIVPQLNVREEEVTVLFNNGKQCRAMLSENQPLKMVILKGLEYPR
ncbi:MAG: hypothetical protein AB1403_13265 [Candidatus Riflebacteria bacterium]